MNRYISIIFLMSVLLNPLLAQQNESVSIQTRSFGQMQAPRQVQYWPEEDGIVCLDGNHSFSRSLYCPISQTSIETSDYPEFGLALPFNGGNLRFDIEHTQVRASYDGMSREYRLTLPASMRHNSRQEAYVLISAYALQLSAAGGVWQIEGRNVKAGVKLQMRYGAATGTDEQDYTFSLDRCSGNRYTVDTHGSFFEVQCGKADQSHSLRGQVSPAIRMKLVDGKDGNGKAVQYLTATIPLEKPSVVVLSDLSSSKPGSAYNLQTLLFESESKSNAVVADYELQTPDPLINPLEYVLPAAAYRLSSVSQGHPSDLSQVDELLHKMAWKGNLKEVRRHWSSIQDVLAKAKKQGDPDNDGLYRACAIVGHRWEGQHFYGEAAVTYSTALALRVNRKVAGIARLLGEEKLASQYASEADLIQNAINSRLWLEKEGVWAEYQEAWGLKRQYRYPAMWTVSQAIASEVGSPEQRQRATRYVDECLPKYEVLVATNPRCPVSMGNQWGEVISTSDWQPACGSCNGVSLAEEMQMALAYWQAGRTDEAYSLFRGALAEGMYLGSTPGNLSQTSYYDVLNGETGRDSKDAVSAAKQALVEGLIGIQPDLLSGILTIKPGFPSSWDGEDVFFATPDFEFRRTYKGKTPVWYFMGQGDFFDRYDSIVVQVPAQSAFAGELADKEGVRWVKTEPLTSHLSPLTSHLSSLTSHLSPLTSHLDYTNPSSIDWSTLLPVTTIAKKHNLKVADIFKQHYNYKEDKHHGAVKEAEEESVPFVISDALGLKAAFTSQWKNFPDKLIFKLPKKQARRLYLKMVGTTNALQSHIENGIVRVMYADGSVEELPLVNPINWWPVEQELAQGLPSFYLQKGEELLPPYRMSLRTGKYYRPRTDAVGVATDGGAATILELPLDSAKKLKSLELECLSNGIVIGIIEAYLDEVKKK